MGRDLTAIDLPKARPNLHAGHDILRERGARIAERGRSLGHVDVAATQFPQEAPPGFEPGIKDLQSSALPLGHGADAEKYNVCNHPLGVKANS